MHDFDPSSACGGGGIFGLPHSPEQARVVLVPVPWEATVSYGAGTADGPATILRASQQVDLLDREAGRPYQAGIAMLEIPADIRAASDEARALAMPVIEAGGAGQDAALRQRVAQVDALGERVNGWVYARAQELIAAGKLVGVVGGDHSVPYGAIRAMAERHPELGILHVDAHADLRTAYEGFRWSHASIMRNVLQDVPGVARIVQMGIRDFCDEEDELIRDHPNRLRTFFEADTRRHLLEGTPWSRLVGRIVAELPQKVYVSFDIDGLDPALCPGTGTPVPGGLSFAEATFLLRAVTESGRTIVGFDLVEVGSGEWDGNVGARLLYKLIGFALMRQPS